MAILKNTIVNDVGSVILPVGTTAQRPGQAGQPAVEDGAFRYNTDLGWAEYYYNGFWINAETNKGGVPTEGLIFLADVDNPASWDGTTLTDVIGGVTITRSGTITQGTTDTGSKILSGGTSAYINIPLNVSTATGDVFTVMTVAGYNGSSRGRITASGDGGNNWLLGHHGGFDTCYFSEGWVNDQNSSGGGAANNQWGVHTGTGDSKVDEYQYYKNGGYRVTTLSGGSQGPTSLSINRWSSSSQPSDWKWQFLAVWDRVLGKEEIVELTSSIRTRGGF